jgi:hypothetical protein
MTKANLFEPAEQPPAATPLGYTDAYFEPPDVIEAHDEWTAKCGPCAFAAVLGLTLAQARQHFPGVTERGGWVNPTHMQSALRSAGRRFTVYHGTAVPVPAASLVFVQFTGPWTAPEANPRWAYRHTHWVACRRDASCRVWVYDVNASGWVSSLDWIRHVARELIAARKRADGWQARLTLTVEDAI